ncbi:MAG: Gfo/Idh/MocA family oxidoreductase [Chloroflexi bacterium]|nr:Gfo/Idh/MocA family oxidoreductase [Chloroflexota bacterium]
MADRPGIGVIGAGAVAMMRHLPAFAEARAAGTATIAAIYDLDPDRARQAAAAFEIPAVCESIDALLALPAVTAVSVCTPNVAHHAHAMAALRVGKHVLCEKPLALTLAEAREMTVAAAAAGVITGINFRYRWIPAARFVTDLVASGALGRIYHGVFHYFNGSMADPATPAAWRAQRAQAGTGVLGDLGSHLIDLAASWLGEATAAGGELLTFTAERPDGDGGRIPIDTDDAAAFTVHYAGGAVGHFVASRSVMGRGNFQRIELYGSGGGVTYEFDKWDRGGDLVRVCLGGAQARNGGYATVQVSPDHLLGTPAGPLLEWVTAVREGRPAAPSFADGLRCQEIMAAIETSAAEGRMVTLPLGQ